MDHIAKLDWLQLHIKFHETHANSGWEPVSENEVKRRFIYYHQWLEKKGLTEIDEFPIDEEFVLYENQVTEKGWKFLKKVHDRFISLQTPGRSIEEDKKYLEKRYDQIIGE